MFKTGDKVRVEGYVKIATVVKTYTSGRARGGADVSLPSGFVCWVPYHRLQKA